MLLKERGLEKIKGENGGGRKRVGWWRGGGVYRGGFKPSVHYLC